MLVGMTMYSNEGCNWWIQWRGVMNGALEGCNVGM